MLAVLFSVGDDTYALPSASVIEVVPRLELRAVASAPLWLAGLARVRGAIVPIIDLSARIANRAASTVLSTRIALVRVSPAPRAVGVLAERMTGTARLSSDAAFRTLSLPDAPYLGDVMLDDGRLVQLVRPDKLFTGDIAEMLFAETA